MSILVTGSAGHLGEALVRTLQSLGSDVVGLDLVDSSFINEVGSIADRAHVKQCMNGVNAVIHTATLHKPHIVTHTRQDFIGTNITGTLNLLGEAASVGVAAFIFTSTTSAFGGALTSPAEAPAVWVTEDTTSVPRDIEIFEHNKLAFHERFHDHAARIMRKYGFNIVAMWEAQTDR